jgi:glycosyltransferase involved in cell wall biosynthesis
MACNVAATLAGVSRSKGVHGNLLIPAMPSRESEIAPGEREAQAGLGLRISVIVPVHNGSQVLGRCIEALNCSTYPNFEVIVVDDCSTDTTPQIVERYGMRCIRTPRIMGPGGARNLGSKHARGEILAFIDADVMIPPEGLGLMEEAFSCDPKLAAVFGSYDDEPACDTFISQYKNLMHHYVHQSSSELATTFWAGCGAVRKSVFEEVGGFDDVKYIAPSVEDIALGLELTRRGYTIRLDKRLTAKHLKQWTVLSLLRADIFGRAVPWTQMILNSGQVPRDLNLSYASRISAALVGLLTAVGLSLPVIFARGWRDLFLPTVAAVAITCVALLFLNWDVYRFFWRKRGLWFAARSVIAHWAYYLYSGITFAVVAAEKLIRTTASRRGVRSAE